MTDRPRTNTNKTGTQGPSKNLIWIRGLMLILFGAAITAIWLLDVGNWLNMEAFRTHHSDLAVWVEGQRTTAAIVYVALYVTLVLFLIPGPFFATLVGGALFGPIAGTFLTILGATGGAILVFLATKTAAGAFMEKWVGNRIQVFVAGFRKNELSYMFVLRLIPVFPFSLITISAAILGVKFRNFFVATSLGILPAAYIISLTGASLSDLVNTDEQLSLSSVFTPQASAALTGLVILAIIPLLHKWVKQ
jgi:uncharacterized membrane protein YdjX (TVP38/TMEM64 family)